MLIIERQLRITGRVVRRRWKCWVVGHDWKLDIIFGQPWEQCARCDKLGADW